MEIMEIKIGDMVRIIKGAREWRGKVARVTGIVGEVTPFMWRVQLDDPVGKTLLFLGDELEGIPEVSL